MSRRARVAVAGIPWHIIQRGNNRSACFYSEDDYCLYLHLLEEQAQKHGCAIHAYCLMTNHVHLLLTPETASGPSLMMKHLGQRYVQYINRTYSRSGTLWEGRFKSCLAQSDSYLFICSRYIELNPVRAAMVAMPGQYRWSSFTSNGEGKLNRLISHHPRYLALGTSAPDRCRAYRDLFYTHDDNEAILEIRQATQGNYVLGDSRFSAEIEQILGRRVLPGKSGRPVVGC
jgi:putative transposase